MGSIRTETHSYIDLCYSLPKRVHVPTMSEYTYFEKGLLNGEAQILPIQADGRTVTKHHTSAKTAME